MTSLKVSEDIDAWCIKCKMMLKHVIMSMKETRPHRVKCKTCRDVHAFRLTEPGAAKAKAPRAPKKPGKTRVTKSNEYARLMEGRDQANAIGYTIAGTFSPNDFIKHKKFGFGIVTRQVDPTKIEVLFSDGTKVLVCGR